MAKISVEPAPHPVEIKFNGETVAKSKRALLLCEGTYDPVYYFPRDDVHLKFFKNSDHTTHCPFKGDASYWHLEAGGKRVDNAAWSYANAMPGADLLNLHIAFYKEHVEVIVHEG